MARHERFPIDGKCIGIRISGWLSIIVGYGLGLLPIRGLRWDQPRIRRYPFSGFLDCSGLPAISWISRIYVRSRMACTVDCERQPTTKNAVRVGSDSTGCDSPLQLRSPSVHFLQLPHRMGMRAGIFVQQPEHGWRPSDWGSALDSDRT